MLRRTLYDKGLKNDFGSVSRTALSVQAFNSACREVPIGGARDAANRTAIDDLYEITCNFRVECEYTFMYSSRSSTGGSCLDTSRPYNPKWSRERWTCLSYELWSWVPLMAKPSPTSSSE